MTTVQYSYVFQLVDLGWTILNIWLTLASKWVGQSGLGMTLSMKPDGVGSGSRGQYVTNLDTFYQEGRLLPLSCPTRRMSPLSPHNVHLATIRCLHIGIFLLQCRLSCLSSFALLPTMSQVVSRLLSSRAAHKSTLLSTTISLSSQC